MRTEVGNPRNFEFRTIISGQCRTRPGTFEAWTRPCANFGTLHPAHSTLGPSPMACTAAFFGKGIYFEMLKSNYLQICNNFPIGWAGESGAGEAGIGFQENVTRRAGGPNQRNSRRFCGSTAFIPQLFGCFIFFPAFLSEAHCIRRLAVIARCVFFLALFFST